MERVFSPAWMRLLGALDQPTMDGINTYFVSWAAKQVGLKVALSGLAETNFFAATRLLRIRRAYRC